MTSTATTKPRPWRELQRLVELDGHWTYPALATAAGISKGYMSLLLNGHRPPTHTVISKIAGVLRVPKTMLEPVDSPRRVAYTPTEVAEMVGVPLADVIELIDAGQLKARRIGDREVVSDLVLTKFLSEHDADVADGGEAA
jgi:transcriptional regulator with XRE-family HTH domain